MRLVHRYHHWHPAVIQLRILFSSFTTACANSGVLMWLFHLDHLDSRIEVLPETADKGSIRFGVIEGTALYAQERESLGWDDEFDQIFVSVGAKYSDNGLE
jgi:hypothetical protein